MFTVAVFAVIVRWRLCVFINDGEDKKLLWYCQNGKLLNNEHDGSTYSNIDDSPRHKRIYNSSSFIKYQHVENQSMWLGVRIMDTIEGGERKWGEIMGEGSCDVENGHLCFNSVPGEFIKCTFDSGQGKLTSGEKKVICGSLGIAVVGQGEIGGRDFKGGMRKL